MSRNAITVIAAVTFAGCATEPSQVSGSAAATGSSATAQSTYTPCAIADAQGAWSSVFVPQQYGASQNFGFFAYPSEPSGRPIDMVFGLANGPAATFSDLGPIVRFNADGFIDARDGDRYRADAAIPYTPDGRLYLVDMKLDFTAHTYTATVASDNSPEITIGANYHFRSEQADMARADNFATELDSATGSMRTCYPGGSTNYHVTSAGEGWFTTPLRPQSGQLHVEFETETWTSNIDAVIGLAAAAPTRFTDLAAIARYAPDGTIDARDGGTYRAETSFAYRPYTTYTFMFDVDVAAHTYSLAVKEWNTEPVTIARDYAFRSEQAGVTSLAALGQFVDGASGTMYTGRLLETY